MTILEGSDSTTAAFSGSAGSVIAFGLNHEDLVSGDVGVLCSFGAGYSIGSLVIRKRLSTSVKGSSARYRVQ